MVSINIIYICEEKLNQERDDYMEELFSRLNAIPNSYFEFVDSVIDYAEEKETHLYLITEYLNTNPSATPSDVLKFITFQPDFFDNEEVHANNTLLVG